MSTLVEELEQAAGRNEVSCRKWRASLGREPDLNCDCPVATEARRLRQRVAWVRELEASAHPNGSLGAIRLLIGPNMSRGAPPAFVGLMGTGSAFETEPTPWEPSPAAKLRPHAWERPLRCRQCGGEAEEARRVYATPVCYKCLPPPAPLPVVATPAAEPGKPATCGALANDGTACVRPPHPDDPDYHADARDYYWMSRATPEKGGR